MTSHRRTDPARVAALAANRALLTVTAVAVAAGALVAACAPATPRPVDGHRAAGAPRTPAPEGEVDRALRAAGATGPGLAVWVANPRWVDGDPGAEPLVRALEWVAPTGSGADPHGTVTVWQDPAGGGEVTLAARDDDADLAAALATVGPADTLVRDRGDWLVVTGDVVRPLLDASRGGPAQELTVEEYREVLVRRARDAVGAGDTVGG